MLRRNVVLSLVGFVAIASIGLAQVPSGKAEEHSDKACWTCADTCLDCIDACAVAMAKDPARLECLRACVACNRECVNCARNCEAGTCTPEIEVALYLGAMRPLRFENSGRFELAWR
jgi:hypothetical protein